MCKEMSKDSDIGEKVNSDSLAGAFWEARRFSDGDLPFAKGRWGVGAGVTATAVLSRQDTER